MASSSLDELRKHRDDSRLAEVAALLHDWQKCVDMAVASHWQNNPSVLPAKVSEWKNRGTILNPADFARRLAALDLSDGTARIDMKTLCQEGRNPGAATHPNHLVELLRACHDLAHVEKELGENEAKRQASDRISQAFGYECVEPSGSLGPLLTRLAPLLDGPRSLDRTEFLNRTRQVFTEVWGDTRQPINEVTLWDWSYAVASLYKSELARHFLTGEWRQRDKLRWRLLRINFDVLELYSHAIKLADLFGYARAVQEACEQTKRFVEDEYPLGNEVYRDTTGIYFIFPDFDLDDYLKQEIRQIVESVELELAPRIDAAPAEGKSPEKHLKRLLADQRSKACKQLAIPFDRDNLNPCWNALWENLPNGAWEVCPVCRLRPKKEHQKACEHCKKRRESRIEQWLRDPETTIWLDEIADCNDRIAVVVAKFGLDDWLSGDLVETLLVKAAENSPVACVSKNPSPARLRRIWETCQQFWTKTVTTELKSHTYGALTPTAALRLIRLAVTPQEQFKWKTNIPYDGTFRGNPISLLWLGQTFVTISNLQLAAGDAKQLDELIENLTESGIDLKDPDDSRRRIELAVKDARKIADPLGTYEPCFTLVESPDQFLALVPGAEALDLATKIRNAYGLEFGKVQDRLPIFLGLVFFPRKTPLFAAIDAARRMLSQVELQGEQWVVECSCPSPDGQHHRVRLSRQSDRIDYDIPVKMGDKQTEDVWYPYVFVESGADDRGRRFQIKQGKFADRWLVHASQLRPVDQVRVMPSLFSYIFLEHSAQRFEFDAQRDVMYLGDLSRLAAMWTGIRQTPQMTDTKLRNVAGLLQEKEVRKPRRVQASCRDNA